MVWTRYHFPVDTTGCGPAREIGPRLGELDTGDWKEYSARIAAWMEAMTDELARERDTVARIRRLQWAMLEVVNEMLAEAQQKRQERRKARDPTYAGEDEECRLCGGDAGPGDEASGTDSAYVRKKILHLFSGPPRRKDGLMAMARERGIEVVEIDTLVDKCACDMTDDTVHNGLMSRILQGEFMGAMIGTPCSTFSVARLNYDPDAPGPTPVRSRADK